jgi:carbamoyl-phosphate synthase small subunit
MSHDGEGVATLALETGECFRGRLFGGASPGGLGREDPSPAPVGGEVVFHTGMTGYQEILTDPSYAGQIIVFTAPHIGNYGIHAGEDESPRIHPTAVIVRDHCQRSFHQRADRSLEDVLRLAHVPGLTDVDTRALTVLLRERGSCRGVVGTGPSARLVQAAREIEPMERVDWVSRVTCSQPFELDAFPARRGRSRPYRVAVLDFGVKASILEHLRRLHCSLRVLPARTPASEILRERPDGIFLSNGPGDPALLDDLVETVRELIHYGRPVFGICLGHQLLGRALGGKTYKLPFGHHGANHPVRREDDGRIEISSHNHNYALDPNSLDASRVRVTHYSLNDGCVEGFEVPGRPVYSVQYHPEAAPGPRDGVHLFQRFCREMDGARSTGAED